MNKILKIYDKIFNKFRKELKKRLKYGENLIGTWITLPHSGIAVIFSINPKLSRVYMEKRVVSKFERDKRIWETVSAALDDKYWRLKYD